MNWKSAIPHVLVILSFVLITGVYFSPQIQGEKINQSDITSYKGMSAEAREYQKETGDYPLWTNVMFGGMPTYMIGAKYSYNLLRYGEKLTRLYISRPIGYFISSMICMYVFMLIMGVRPWIAAVSAVGFSFTTYHFILYEAGHTSKMRAINLFPLVAAGVIAAYRKKYLLGGGLFAVGMGMSIYANHIQMTYYLSLVLGVYIIFRLVKDIRSSEIMSFVKASAALLLGLILALGASSARLLTTMEYTDDTMRGEPILENASKQQQESSSTKGLAWDYSMRWSQGMKDVVTLIIPGAAGGGSIEEAEWSDELKNDRGWSQVLRAYDGKAPLYHGDLPFTSGPAYVGIVMFFLFVLSFFNTKGMLRWWALAASILIIMISMGSHLEWFNRLLFDNLPLFNKFRSPNSATAVSPLLTALMAGLALESWFKNSREYNDLFKKYLVPAVAVTVACLLLSWITANSYGFESAGDARFAQQGLDVDVIESARASLLSGDLMRNIILMLLIAGALYGYAKSRINVVVGLVIISLLNLGDLWTVGKRYLDSDTFEPARRVNNSVTPRDVDKQIMKDKDPYFRVYDLSINTFNSSTSSNFYKTIGGYHAAKLQRYQDMISYHISKGNQSVLNMLNTKYIITQDQQLQQNPGAMGNAWFIKDVKYVKSNNEEINALNNFSPDLTAIVHQDFKDELGNTSYTDNGRIELTSYSPEKLEFTSQNSGRGLAVFSDVWYGPDKGWKAYVDGEEVPIVRANYILRAIEVPAGKHDITFEFYPTTYHSYSSVSLISSILAYLFLGFGIYFQYKEEYA